MNSGNKTGTDIFSATKNFWNSAASSSSKPSSSYDVESGGGATATAPSSSGGMAIGSGVGDSFSVNNLQGYFKNFGVKSGLMMDTDAPDAAKLNSTDASYTDELSDMTSLSPQQRIYGFLLAILMGAVFIWISIGFVLSGTIALFAKKFAFFFTCGNFFIVCAPSFLVGPKRQLESMTQSHRLHAVMLYAGCTFMTLVSALYLHSSVLSVAFAVAQVGSVVWYGLSFIPFARQVLSYTWTYLAVILKPILSGVCTVLSNVCGCCWKAILSSR